MKIKTPKCKQTLGLNNILKKQGEKGKEIEKGKKNNLSEQSN